MAIARNTIKHWYVTYGPMVFRRCFKLLKTEEAAAEAMQDVFVKLLTKEGSLKDAAPVSLLYILATNTCLNILRARKSRPEDPNADILDRIAGAPDPEEEYGARELLNAVFSEEKSSTKVMAVLHLLDEMTLEEVALETGLSVSGVRKRLRALKQHVKELEGL